MFDILNEILKFMRRLEHVLAQLLAELRGARAHRHPHPPTLSVSENSMTQAVITLTLPSTYSDGSPFSAANYGGAVLFKAGTQIGQITAPTLTFTDPTVTDQTPGTFSYTAAIHDTNGQPSPQSEPAILTVTAAPPAPTPSAPTISVALA